LTRLYDSASDPAWGLGAETNPDTFVVLRINPPWGSCALQRIMGAPSDPAGCLAQVANNFMHGIGCSCIRGTKRKANYFDPRNASAKPSKAQSYTQWVRPGAHPVQDLQRLKMFSRAPKDLVQDVGVQLGPPALRGLTEVDLGAIVPSRVPVSEWLPCSVTRHRLPSTQGLGFLTEGSSTDQDGGSNKTPILLGILTDLLPCINPSRS
jgi:hypothetical protein